MKLSKEQEKRIKEIREKHKREEQLILSLINETFREFQIVAKIIDEEQEIDDDLLDNVARGLELGIERMKALQQRYKDDVSRLSFIKAEYTDNKMKEYKKMISGYEKVLKKIKDRDGELFQL